jgi:Fe-S-cluster containining protein
MGQVMKPKISEQPETGTMIMKQKNIAATTKDACEDCPALCCRDLAMLIPKPRTKSEISDIRWFLHYQKVEICIRSNRWYIVVKTKCRYLNRNNRCTNYEERDETCRRHNPPDCEKFGAWYQTRMTTPEELDEYLESKRR